jgi:hypothetical protein
MRLRASEGSLSTPGGQRGFGGDFFAFAVCDPPPDSEDAPPHATKTMHRLTMEIDRMVEP